MVVNAGVVNVFPVAKAVPPVAAANHAKLVPPLGVALKMVVLPAQVVKPELDTVGAA